MAGKSRRPVSDQQLINDYDRLKSAKAVADLYGISDQTVYYVLGKNKIVTLSGAERRQERVSDEQIIDAYNRTGNGTKAAKELGVNDRTVYRVLANHGIQVQQDKGKRRVFSGEKLAELINGYEAGESAVSLSKKYNCAVWTVLAALEAAGMDIRRVARMTEEEIAEAKSLYESGLTFKQVGEKLGRADASVIRVLTRHYPEIIRSDLVGPGSPHWKGGRFVHHGYVYVWVAPDDELVGSMRNQHGYALEHRVVMSRKLGRQIRDNETVHHIDGDKTNNDPDNLQLRQGRHGKHVVMRCRQCGSYDVEHAEISDRAEMPLPDSRNVGNSEIDIVSDVMRAAENVTVGDLMDAMKRKAELFGPKEREAFWEMGDLGWQELATAAMMAFVKAGVSRNIGHVELS
jgi:hypothetical protein